MKIYLIFVSWCLLSSINCVDNFSSKMSKYSLTPKNRFPLNYWFAVSFYITIRKFHTAHQI